MKTLYLLRHAKSSWDDPALDDFERPLNKRGLKTAPVMGQLMRERNIDPDLVLCSPAMRTKETAKLAFKAAHLKPEVQYEENIYEAGLKDLLAVIRTVDNSVSTLMIVGHNPGMEELLYGLTGTVEEFPTAALAKISVKTKFWKDVSKVESVLDWIVRPKDIGEKD